MIRGLDSRLSDRGNWRTLLINGKVISVMVTANATASKVTIVVSLKNCNRNWRLWPPSTLRTAISLARLMAWAVERLIKFAQAINNMNAAISQSVLIRFFEIYLPRK